MNLTLTEILDLIKVSRENPSLEVEDIFRQIVENNNAELKYHAMINGFSSLFTKELESLRPSCKSILTTCCEIHNIFPELIKSKSRKGELVRIRQQYCLITHLFKHSFRVTGEVIFRDHATVLNAKNKALYYYHSEDEYNNEVNEIIDKFPLYSSTLTERLLTLTKT